MGRVEHGFAIGLAETMEHTNPDAYIAMAGEAAITLNSKAPEDRTPEEIQWVEVLSSRAARLATRFNLELMGVEKE